ncbi:MAG: hypothetical protein LHV69_03575 [Elusimicrobia bacterium]|nr:hypothetical protein [Candidatus Obscuribacterium magneticum]
MVNWRKRIGFSMGTGGWKSLVLTVILSLLMTPLFAAPENLDETFDNRKPRRPTATWGSQYLENPSTYLWQPETFMYHDIVTGHEVWKMSNTALKRTYYQMDIGVSPWSADGKKVAFTAWGRAPQGYRSWEQDYIWMTADTNGLHLRPTVEAGSRIGGGYFHWSPQIPNVYYERGSVHYGAGGDPTTVYKSTVLDDGTIVRKPLITGAPTGGFSKMISADGKRAIVCQWRSDTAPVFMFPIVLWPDADARVLLPNGYTENRGFEPYGNTPSRVIRYHDAYYAGDGSYYFAMPSGSATWWKIQTLGTAPDGGGMYKWVVTLTNLTGAFTANEPLDFPSSRATGIYLAGSGSQMEFFVNSPELPWAGETIRGRTSGATAVLSVIENQNPFGEVSPENHGAIAWILASSQVNGTFGTDCRDVSEQVSFSPSGARATLWCVSTVAGITQMNIIPEDPNHLPQLGDTITGQTSGATAHLDQFAAANKLSPYVAPTSNYDPNLTAYWSHFVPDRWGRCALFSNVSDNLPRQGSYSERIGPGVWDITNHRYVVPSFGGGAQHHDWHGFTDWTVSSIGWPYIDQKVAAQIYNDPNSQIVINSAYTRYDGGSDYASLVRPGQSPDGTKVAWHSEFLNGRDAVDIFWSVVCYPYPPTDLEAGDSNNRVMIRFLPPKYTERRWINPATMQIDEANGEVLYAREIKQYNLWSAPALEGPWDIVQTAPAEYANDDRTNTLKPRFNGNWVGDTNKIGVIDNPGPGVWFFALTSQEHSNLDSQELSDILQVTVRGTAVDYSIVQIKGRKSFWTTKPRTPVLSVTPGSIAGHFSLRWTETTDSKVRYYNIYYSNAGSPQLTQNYRSASVPVGSVAPGEAVTHLDWLADPAAPAYYRITAVDRYGNESDGSISEDPIINPHGMEDKLQSVVNWIHPKHADKAVFSLLLVNGGAVEIKIYDQSGQLVKEIREAFAEGGPRQVAWDITNTDGRSVASGVYFADVFINGQKVAKGQRIAVVK